MREKLTGWESAQGVPDLEHAAFGFEWSDVRLFVLIALAGSLRRASAATGRSIGAIRRRVHYLEQRAGCKLLVTSSSGSHLTPDGEHLLQASQAMVEAAARIGERLNLTGRKSRQMVRIAVADELGLFWLIPRVQKFRRLYPDLHLDLHCVAVPPDVFALQADLSVQLRPPDHDDLIVARLGYLHMHEFASKSFLEAQVQLGFNPVMSRQPEAQMPAGQTIYETVPGVASGPGAGPLRINSMAARYLAITHGAGTGHLPNYARLIDPRLVALHERREERHDVFLTYRRDMLEIGPLSVAIDWIKSCINPRRYPWFSHDYIHPNQLDEAAMDLDLD